VLAIRAAFVESEAGNLEVVLVMWLCCKLQFLLLRLRPGTVVKCKNVDAHQPATKCPDAVNTGRLGKRFEDGRQSKKGEVDQDGRLGSSKTLDHLW
jgi:hypothetical protein